jgi:hypothetical protein
MVRTADDAHKKRWHRVIIPDPIKDVTMHTDEFPLNLARRTFLDSITDEYRWVFLFPHKATPVDIVVSTN